MMAALASFLVFVGLAGLLGGLAAQRRLAGLTVPGGWPRWWAASALLILVGTALQVGTTLVVLGFTAPADVLDYLTTTGPGRAALITLLGTALLLAAGVGGWPAWLSVGLAGLSAAITLWGLAGQGHGAEHGTLTRLAHATHAGLMALWVGGVAALWSGRPSDWPGNARAFTPLAVVCVVGLVLSGLVMSLEHAGPLAEWVDQPYDQLLLVKLGVFVVTLLAAQEVREHLTQSSRPRLALMLELILLLVVLGLTAVLVNSAPPSHNSEEMQQMHM
ncbi:copper resistance protein CopD [Deinococcus irradiatisoli]|uniref:Copper resistance protein CopD n=1 Tax=Deinococcus irradiatisoli TaxID=2202254 RepID=A0A2Z3JH23_9DEIO|nr:CopD family protein [Deinococcus irradiatisoli]AWN24292.1 copper resistance protein CopD [Deinococcus irradiatisoli]